MKNHKHDLARGLLYQFGVQVWGFSFNLLPVCSSLFVVAPVVNACCALLSALNIPVEAE